LDFSRQSDPERSAGDIPVTWGPSYYRQASGFACSENPAYEPRTK